MGPAPKFRSWSYRVVEVQDGPFKLFQFQLYECFYDEEGTITNWYGATSPHGETLEELHEDASMQRAALMEPVLVLPKEEE